jgi:hypothetical protein
MEEGGQKNRKVTETRQRSSVKNAKNKADKEETNYGMWIKSIGKCKRGTRRPFHPGGDPFPAEPGRHGGVRRQA